MITPKELHDIFDYDQNTGLLTWKNPTGRRRKAGEVAGCPSPDGRVLVGVKGRLYKAHRIIWAMMTGKWPEKHVDHINMNGFDNRWANLREASQAENMRNKMEISSNTSGHRGVSFNAKLGKWCARIKVSNKTITLGHFLAFDSAVRARVAAEARYFGEFAPHQNLPSPIAL